ncbi:hypothetical protein Taro_008770 [Colocasia esculenta]|uniref:Uncharacterized protein n=1 Tax=Colocasia esculenta TaxID=4460 RepID=A0A843U3X2_COLES|nr:hypothetical protein [Colocasia esculenta]
MLPPFLGCWPTHGPLDKTGANKCPPPGDGASEDRAEQRPQLLKDGFLYPWRSQTRYYSHELRLDYETSNVVSIPQKEAGLRHLSRNDYLWEVNFDFISLETPVLKMLSTKVRFEIVRAWKSDFEISGHRGPV